MSSRKLSAAAALARRQASSVRSNPWPPGRSADMAWAMGARVARCETSRPVASRPARCSRASFSSRCERTSLTCATGVSSHPATASRPGGVIA